jgi:hypothetical protein
MSRDKQPSKHDDLFFNERLIVIATVEEVDALTCHFSTGKFRQGDPVT